MHLLLKSYSISYIRILSFTFMLLAAFQNSGCRSGNNASNKTLPGINSLSDPVEASEMIKSRTFQNADSTWGYMIFINGKMTLYQRSIPYSKDGRGFISEESARQVAEIVCKNLLKNHLAQPISKEELDSLGII